MRNGNEKTKNYSLTRLYKYLLPLLLYLTGAVLLLGLGTFAKYRLGMDAAVVMPDAYSMQAAIDLYPQLYSGIPSSELLTGLVPGDRAESFALIGLANEKSIPTSNTDLALTRSFRLNVRNYAPELEDADLSSPPDFVAEVSLTYKVEIESLTTEKNGIPLEFVLVPLDDDGNMIPVTEENPAAGTYITATEEEFGSDAGRYLGYTSTRVIGSVTDLASDTEHLGYTGLYEFPGFTGYLSADGATAEERKDMENLVIYAGWYNRTIEEDGITTGLRNDDASYRKQVESIRVTVIFSEVAPGGIVYDEATERDIFGYGSSDVDSADEQLSDYIEDSTTEYATLSDILPVLPEKNATPSDAADGQEEEGGSDE